jgi:hypothetical protein
MRIPLWRTLAVVTVPFLGMCFSVPLWDRVHPVVLGMPFNLFWLVLWIPLTSVCIAVAHRIESARGGDPDDTP